MPILPEHHPLYAPLLDLHQKRLIQPHPSALELSSCIRRDLGWDNLYTLAFLMNAFESAIPGVHFTDDVWRGVFERDEDITVEELASWFCEVKATAENTSNQRTEVEWGRARPW